MAEILTYTHTQSEAFGVLQNCSPLSDSVGNHTSSAPPQTHASRIMQVPRNHFNSAQSATGYRGTSSPTVPYIFKSIPQLSRPVTNTSAYPIPSESRSTTSTARHPGPSPSVSTTSSATSSSWGFDANSKEELDPSSNISNRHFTPANMVTSVSELMNNINNAPEPHRRGQKRLATDTSLTLPTAIHNSTSSNMAGKIQTGRYIHPSSTQTIPLADRPNGMARSEPQPDISDKNSAARPVTPDSTGVSSPTADLGKRYKNSNRNNIEAATTIRVAPASSQAQRNQPSNSSSQSSPTNGHLRLNNHDAQTATSPISNTRQSPQYAGQTSNPSSPPFEGKRAFSPSPFPRPSTAEVAPRSSTDTIHTLNSGRPLTAATASMAALNNKEQGKGMRSRLRRAFSFGSTAELKRVTGEADPAVDRAKKRQEQFSIGLNDEQDAIARKQAAGGLGNSIYSGQGRRFGGSVDNLSISSTASSASMLVRKMNEGMKKSGRSIKGIFRPKSVIGVPAADRPSRPSVGSVSFVNVEAEREIVNVNSDPHDQAGGGTGFPRLERNSLDMDAATRQQQQQLAHQDMDMRSIAATENPTRAVILPSGKRGILKRSSSAPLPLPSPERPYSSYINDARPTSPSVDRRTGLRRTESPVRGIGGFETYSRQSPGAPRGANSSGRNISFSPRIVLHDVWSASEYDRRGEVATCNRLTPLLAQQIKEELNTFKMEMEVHELSKLYTHFF